MSKSRHAPRKRLVQTLVVVAIAASMMSVAVLTRLYNGPLTAIRISQQERAALWVAAIEHLARESDISDVAISNETGFGEIDPIAARDITERVRRMGHRLAPGWDIVLARVNSASERLPNHFSSTSIRLAVTHSLSGPELKIPDRRGECVVSSPVVIDGIQESLGVVWYSFRGSNGGGTGVIVLSTTDQRSGWVVVQDNPIGVY